MAQQAKITSVEAIEAFRASLILYLNKVRPTLEEVGADVSRVRSWLQHDQRRHWDNQLRIRKRRLEEAQAELFNAKISLNQQSTQLPHMAVQRAQLAVQQAEEKLVLLKQWEREMENRTDPLTRQIEQFHGYLSSDMARAVTQLGQLIETLDAYADVLKPAPASPGEPAPTPGTSEKKGDCAT